MAASFLSRSTGFGFDDHFVVRNRITYEFLIKIFLILLSGLLENWIGIDILLFISKNVLLTFFVVFFKFMPTFL